MRAKSTSPTARAPSASYATTLSATSEAHSAAWKPPHASSARRSARFVHSSPRAASRALFVVVPTAARISATRPGVYVEDNTRSSSRCRLLDHGRAVGDEHVLDGQVEQRSQRLAQVGVRRLPEPALGDRGGAGRPWRAASRPHRAGRRRRRRRAAPAASRPPPPRGRSGRHDPAGQLSAAASSASTPRFASGRSERDGAHDARLQAGCRRGRASRRSRARAPGLPSSAGGSSGSIRTRPSAVSTATEPTSSSQWSCHDGPATESGRDLLHVRQRRARRAGRARRGGTGR